MPRKPKGWHHRYELIRRSTKFDPYKEPRDWWCIVHYFGCNKGAGVNYLDGSDPGPDISDADLIRRAGADSVTVPVYVIRNGVTSEPYFGKYYGQK